MFEIRKKKEIGPNIFQYTIYAPLIVKNAKPGQFVIVIPVKSAERIPLTIFQAQKDEITLIFQVLGSSTKLLSKLKTNEQVEAVLGPLGHAADIDNFNNVLCVAGGVGAAVIFPEVRALKEAGNTVFTVMGARNRDLLILEKEMNQFSDKLIITTDDGSYGEKGLVTEPVKRIIKQNKINRVIAIGPIIMMKAVAQLTKQHNIQTIVSLNPIMVDGTGMCGSCRVEVDGKIKFACVDGPEFDAHLVDFDSLLNRNKQYDHDKGDKCHALS